MYEPTRLLLSFNIAGVKYYDAAFVMDDLKVGSPLTLESEPENPHDSQAVKISFNGKKLGYVPASMCDSLAPFMFYGYKDIFECVLQKKNPEAETCEQLTVGVYLKDAR